MSTADKGNNSEKKHSKSKGVMEGKAESSPESKGDVKSDSRAGVKHELKRQDSKNKSGGGNNSKKESPDIKKELKEKGDAKKERTESKKEQQRTEPPLKKDAGVSPKSKTENNSKKHDCSSKNSNNRKASLGKGRGSFEREEGRGSDQPKLTRQASQEEAITPPPIRRKFSSGRGKMLHRSQGISDDGSSPPPTPDLPLADQSHQHTLELPPFWEGYYNKPRAETMTRLPHQLSGETPPHRWFKQGSIEQARSEPALSREPSQEKELYIDSSGVDLHQFIVETLQKANDRTMLLRLEQDLRKFIQDPKERVLKFPPMTSYHRMIVHRVAAYFGLDHNVDQTGKSVIVNKTPNTRIPEQKFKEHIRDEPDGPAKRILRRDHPSYEEKDLDIVPAAAVEQPIKQDSVEAQMPEVTTAAPPQQLPITQTTPTPKLEKPSKSFEERSQEYQRARERIFNQDGQSSQSSQEGNVIESPVSLVPPGPRVLKGPLQPGSRQNSGTSDDSSYVWSKQDRPWSSVDSSGSERPSIPAVTKASSFAGSSISTRILMRNDSSGSSRSSGSLGSRGSLGKLPRGDSAERGATSPQVRPQPSLPYQPCLGPITQGPCSYPAPTVSYTSSPQAITQVTWAGSMPPGQAPAIMMQSGTSSGGSGAAGSVPSSGPVMYIAPNIESVPPGSVLINPTTKTPYLNQDGTPVVYNPQQVQQPMCSQPQQQAQVSLPSHVQQPLPGQQMSIQQPPPQAPPMAPPQQQQMVSHQSQQMAQYAQPPQQHIPGGPMATQAQSPAGMQPYSMPPPQQQQQQQQVMVHHQHSGEYQDINAQMQGISLSHQLSGEGDVTSPPPTAGMIAQQYMHGPFVRPVSMMPPQGMPPPSSQATPVSQPPHQPQVMYSHPQPTQQQVPQMTYRPSPPTQLVAQHQQPVPMSQPTQIPSSSQLQGPSPVGQGPPVGYPTQGQMLSPQQPMPPPPPQSYQPSYITSMMSQQPPQQQQQQHQPQIVYQPPMEQQQQQQQSAQGYPQSVPVLYQPAVPGTIPTSLGAASQQEVPRPASPGTQGMGQVMASQQQLMNYSPAAMMAAQQRVQQAQAPQLVTGSPYPQAMPASGPGPAPTLHPAQMLQYPGQRRPFGLDQRAMKGREYYGPPDTGYSSPGTSPSQSPGPPFIRTGGERGMGADVNQWSPTGLSIRVDQSDYDNRMRCVYNWVQQPDQRIQARQTPPHGYRLASHDHVFIDRACPRSQQKSKPPRARRQRRIQHSTDQGCQQPPEPVEMQVSPSEILEITNLPPELTCQGALSLLEDIPKHGAEIRWFARGTNVPIPFNHIDCNDRVSNYMVLAVFPNVDYAQNALASIPSSNFTLQIPSMDVGVQYTQPPS